MREYLLKEFSSRLKTEYNSQPPSCSRASIQPLLVTSIQYYSSYGTPVVWLPCRPCFHLDNCSFEKLGVGHAERDGHCRPLSFVFSTVAELQFFWRCKARDQGRDDNGGNCLVIMHGAFGLFFKPKHDVEDFSATPPSHCNSPKVAETSLALITFQ